jgi:hypothetical protein
VHNYKAHGDCILSDNLPTSNLTSCHSNNNTVKTPLHLTKSNSTSSSKTPAYALVIAGNSSPLLEAHKLPKKLPFQALGFPTPGDSRNQRPPFAICDISDPLTGRLQFAERNGTKRQVCRARYFASFYTAHATEESRRKQKAQKVLVQNGNQ